MWARVSRALNDSSTYEFGLWNPSGTHNDTYAMDDKVDVHMGTEPLYKWGSVSALSFNGVDNYVEVPNDATLNFGTSDFTVAFRFKIEPLGAGNYTIMGKGGIADGECWFVFISDGGALTCYLYDDPAVASVISGTGYDDGLWHSAIVTLNRAGNGQWYIDGAASGDAVDITSVTDIDDNATGLRIGCTSIDTWYLPGILDEVCVWNEIISTLDRTDYFNGTPNTTNLQGYWDFDEGYGTTITDRSANTNNGTFVGAEAEIAGAYTGCAIDVDNGAYKGTFTADGGTPYSVFSAGDTVIVSGSTNTNDGAYMIDTVTDTIITTETIIKGTDSAADTGLSIKLDLNNNWVNPKIITGLLQEIEIQRDEYMKNTMVCRGQDYVSILASRLSKAGFPGSDDVTATLVKLINEFASGEFSTIYTESTGISVTNFTVGSEKMLISLMRELSEMPYSIGSFDFYLDGNNAIHWHLRDSALYDSGVTLSGSNIKKFSSRRSTVDKKTYISVTGAHKPVESTVNSQSAITGSVDLDSAHYADDFIANHDVVMSIDLYLQKVGTPSADLIGRIATAEYGSPSGDFRSFLLREEDIPTTAGWVRIPVGRVVSVGTRYFIKLDKCGTPGNTYRWYGETPAVVDLENKARTSTYESAIYWVESDYDLSMKVNYGEWVDINSSDVATPRRDAVVEVRALMDDTTAQLLADQLKTSYLQTMWSAAVTVVPPAYELIPGELVVLNETESGLLSKSYRMDSINWEFGVGRAANEVTIDLSSVLPYSNDMETYVSKMLERIIGTSTDQWESGDAEGAESALIGRARIGRSMIGYVVS